MKYTGGISIIIPIYNESSLVVPAINHLVKKLNNHYRYEIILVENGSKDNTYELAKELSNKYKMIRVFRLIAPCYGAALKKGIISARYSIIIQFDLDLIDMFFLKKAVILLQANHVVVGSKMLPDSHDQRTPFRYFVSRFTNFLLRTIFHYKGTDTHGIKAYRTKQIASITRKLKPTHHFFDTEILLTAEKQRLSIVELPVSIRNLRPSRFSTKIIISQAVKEFIMLVLKKNEFVRHDSCNLFITVDDFGLNMKVNEIVSVLAKRNIIHNVSVLPNGITKTKLQNMHVSVHINLIEGKPILSRDTVASLVDSRGYFYSFPALYFRLCFYLVNFRELRMEIDAQILKLIKQYGSVYELNSHQHTHTLYPIDTMVNSLASKYNIKRIRRYGRVLHHSFYGYIVYKVLLIFVSIEHFFYGKILSQSPVWQKSEIPLSFMSWETNLRSTRKLYELVCHPGTSYDKNTVYTSILK